MHEQRTDVDWLAGAEAGERIDARALLARGQDPLGAVVERAASIPQGATLAIDAPFDPVPLRRVLAARGFSSHGRRLAPDHWLILCLRDGAGRLDGDGGGKACPGPAGPPLWHVGAETHIDVRGLPAPEPMLAVIRLLSVQPADAVVITHHERDPIFLYPELAEMGWRAEPVPADPGEVRLRLTRED